MLYIIWGYNKTNVCSYNLNKYDFQRTIEVPNYSNLV